jgi:hypothetical protein
MCQKGWLGVPCTLLGLLAALHLLQLLSWPRQQHNSTTTAHPKLSSTGKSRGQKQLKDVNHVDICDGMLHNSPATN